MNSDNKEYCMNNVIEVQGDNTLLLKDVLKGTDVDLTQVKYYTLENGGKGVVLKVFDKNKKQIHVKKRTRLNLAKDVQKIINRCSKTWFPPDLLKLIDKELNE